jgi:FkbM family methyltransferase
LDLAEGIDLAIYLGVYQRIGRHVRDSLARRNLVAVDIGANIGAFTLPLAKLLAPQGRVVAIEPTGFAFDKLKANLALNPAYSGRVTCRQVMLVAEPGSRGAQALFASWHLDTSAQGRHPRHGGMPVDALDATVTTLDELFLSDRQLCSMAGDIGFIKIDVDGNELDVLRGARRLLSDRRPLLMLEIAPYVQNEVAGRLAALVDELLSLGYRLECCRSGRPLPVDALELSRLIPNGAGIDVFCRPVCAVGPRSAAC